MTPEAMMDRVDQEIGVSRWFGLDQERINAFAKLTQDEQFIHVDPVQAAKTPFGGTIAHGFLTLSMASAMAADVLPPLSGVVMGINYGFDSLRFLSPVPAGAQVRGRFVLIGLEDRSDGRWLFKYRLTIEIEGQDKPALVGDWLSMQVVSAA